MSFDKALETVLKWEGVYDNDHADDGGETVFGITRKYNPNWRGWASIEQLKAKRIEPARWFECAPLMEAVEDYYRKTWDDLGLESIGDDPLAYSVFGGAINQGSVRVIGWLQKTLVDMGQNVEIDGVMGAQTLKAIARTKAAGQMPALVDRFNMRRIKAYMQTVAARPSNEKFLAGWLNRIFGGA